MGLFSPFSIFFFFLRGVERQKDRTSEGFPELLYLYVGQHGFLAMNAVGDLFAQRTVNPVELRVRQAVLVDGSVLRQSRHELGR